MKNTAEKRVTNAEFVNGVHPLHWATSPGPSPMGTDPILSSEMVHKWLDTISADCGEVTVQSPQDYVFWKNTEWSFTARKPPMNRK